MQRHWNNARRRIQRLTPNRRHQQTLNMSRQVRFSFQQQQRLAQRTFVHPRRPGRCKRERLTTPTSRSRHTTLPTNLFFVRENPCSLPTLLTRNSASSLLDTLAADYTDLRVREREDRVVNQFTGTREVHKQSGLPESRRPQTFQIQKTINLRRRLTTRAPLSPGSARKAAP